jgi:hypothetical protein
VGDAREHLIEYDRSQMYEIEPREEAEVFDRP